LPNKKNWTTYEAFETSCYLKLNIKENIKKLKYLFAPNLQHIVPSINEMKKV
jgi:hypothetical protein